MSKQSDVKTAQGYIAKAIPQTCGSCKQFKFDRVNANAADMGKPCVYEYWVDANLRCGIGGFVVKKMGTCNSFELKTA